MLNGIYSFRSKKKHAGHSYTLQTLTGISHSGCTKRTFESSRDHTQLIALWFYYPFTLFAGVSICLSFLIFKLMFLRVRCDSSLWLGVFINWQMCIVIVFIDKLEMSMYDLTPSPSHNTSNYYILIKYQKYRLVWAPIRMSRHSCGAMHAVIVSVLWTFFFHT